MGYQFKEIEKKWQLYWKENQTFKAPNNSQKPKYYVLDMFPYPSGAGLHVGHPLGYIASDIYTRFKRHLGFNVLHPMGYDAYGLPAEQYAIQTGTHPQITTDKNIQRYREQLDQIGFSYDWSREIRTSDPFYYKWTQWTFIQLFNSWYNKKTDKAENIKILVQEFEKNGNENINAACDEIEIFSAESWRKMSKLQQQETLMNYRLAYLADTMVNWCEALGTVLANDEVKDGLSERGGHPVEKKLMKQWLLRITAYSQRLLDGFEKIDWSESIVEMQRNWIGRSEGASVVFSLSPALSKGEGGRPAYQTADKKSWPFMKDFMLEDRHNPTEAESLVWENLRNRKIGYKIRRQHVIENFIPDFVCLKKNTVIEIDGGIHDNPDQKEYDIKRTERLQELGFSVIRFRNEEVLNDIGKVLNQIKVYLDKQAETTPSPIGEGWGGAIEVFTTRPDTLFGATFMVLAPEHELVEQIITPERREKVMKYITYAKNRSERERMTEVKKITGEFTGAYAVNPLTGKEIPIWVADYVLAGYGTGAIMAVPAHDSRDFAFAKHFDLPIIQVVKAKNEEPSDPANWVESYDAKEGVMINSGFIDGMEVKEAITATINKLEELGIGTGKINYRLRDAIFSRQRYWGEPFPIYYKDGMPYPLDEKELPLELPPVDKYLPTESGEPPLARAKNWVTKDGYPLETNTMPGFAGSSGYYLRYMDPGNDKEYFSKEANQYWRNVDLYLGGDEHAAGHLIYSRFWNKFLFDLGLVCEDEPFKKLINQGKIQGRSSFVYRANLEKMAEYILWEHIKDKKTGFTFHKDYKDGRRKFDFFSEDAKLIIEIKRVKQLKKLADSYEEYAHEKGYKVLLIPIIEFLDFENVADRISKALHYDEVTPFTETEGLEPVTVFVSKNYPGRENYSDALHVDINLVDNDELNIESFKKWQPHLADAKFILEDGKYICGWEIEKMSKSKHNVQNPDDLIERYGADTLRLYEMFLGPLEQDKPWDIKGIEGVFRFLKKLWKLYFNEDDKLIVTDEKPTSDELKTLHKTIKKIISDMERFSFNTGVSAFMICVNELSDLNCHKRQILEPLSILLAPYAPHIAEELWEKMGHSGGISYVAYPEFDEKFLEENSFAYPVSFNGKMRFKLELPLDMNKEDIEKAAIESAEAKKWIGEQQVVKIIVVPGRIINIVLR